MVSRSGIKVPVTLVRVLGFDGANLTFADNSTPTTLETLPLAAAYHEIASKLRRTQLCKATVHDGVVLMLEPMKTR